MVPNTNITKVSGDSMDNLLKQKFTIPDLEQLYQVLKKANDLKNSEFERLNKMEIELNYLKKMSTKSGETFCHCGICNSLFILFINPSYECCGCHKDFCTNCIVLISSPAEMELCKICHTERLKKLKSGKWLMESKAFTKGKMRNNGANNEIDRMYHYLDELIHDKHTRDAELQVDSGRTSPSFESTKSLSIDNLSKLPLKKIFSVRKPSHFFGDNFDELNIVSSSPNSNSPMSETTSNRLSTSRKESKIVENYDINTNDNDFDAPVSIRNIPKRSFLRCSSNSLNSDFSMVSELFSNDVNIKGKICLSFEYEWSSSLLKVNIKSCENLSVVNETTQETNPFVKVSLLPLENSKHHKFKTKIRQNTTSPVFNETCTFSIQKFSINDRTLNVSVWHWQRVRGSLFLGEVNISLNNVNFNDVTDKWYDFHVRNNINFKPSTNTFNKKFHLENYKKCMKRPLEDSLNKSTSRKESKIVENYDISTNDNDFGAPVSIRNIPKRSFLRCSLNSKPTLLELASKKIREDNLKIPSHSNHGDKKAQGHKVRSHSSISRYFERVIGKMRSKSCTPEIRLDK